MDAYLTVVREQPKSPGLCEGRDDLFSANSLSGRLKFTPASAFDLMAHQVNDRIAFGKDAQIDDNALY